MFAPPRQIIHPPIPHPAQPNPFRHIKVRNVGFEARLPCTTNFIRGDFAAASVATRDSKMRGFISKANAEMLRKTVSSSAASSPSMFPPRDAASQIELLVRVRSPPALGRNWVGEVRVSGSTSEAEGSGECRC